MKKIALIAGLVLVTLGLILAVAVFALASRFETALAAPNNSVPNIKASTDPEVIRRGEYVVRSVGHCGHCHGDTQNQPQRNQADVALSGGFEFKMPPIGTLSFARVPAASPVESK